jgi:hypothetical protein
VQQRHGEYEQFAQRKPQNMRLFVRPVSPRCRISSASGSAWRAAAEPAAHATTTNSPASSEIPNRQNVKAFKHKKYTKTKIGKTLDMHVRRRTRAVPDSIHNGSISPPSNHVPRKTGSRPSNSALGGRHAPLCVVFFVFFCYMQSLKGEGPIGRTQKWRQSSLGDTTVCGCPPQNVLVAAC